MIILGQATPPKPPTKKNENNITIQNIDEIIHQIFLSTPDN